MLLTSTVTEVACGGARAGGASLLSILPASEICISLERKVFNVVLDAANKSIYTGNPLADPVADWHLSDGLE